MKPEVVLHFNSTQHSVDGMKSHIKFNVSPEIVLSPNKQHYMVIKSLSFPLTEYNISAALGNNKMRYSVNKTDEKTGDWKEVTIDDGVYSSASVINDAVQYAVLQNGHTILPDVAENPESNGQRQWPFAVSTDPASSRCFTTINTLYYSTVAASEYKQVSVDWTDDGKSTMYELFGFTAAEAVLNGYEAVYVKKAATHNADFGNDQYYLASPLCRSNLGGVNSQIFANDVRFGTAGTLFRCINSYRRSIIGIIKSDVTRINEFELTIIGPDRIHPILLSDDSQGAIVTGEIWFT